MTELLITSLSRDDWPSIFDIFAKEDWHVSQDLVDVLIEGNPKEWLVGKVSGQVVSTVLAIRYSDTFGFMGFYIVHPDFRRRGYGISTFRAGMDHLKGCSIHLAAVEEEVDVYKKIGFNVYGTDVQYTGICRKTQFSVNVKRFDRSYMSQLIEYDTPCFGAPRPKFLEKWINTQPTFCFVYVEKNVLRGFVVVHISSDLGEMQPLFADTKEIAFELFKAAISARAEGSQFVVSTTGANPEGEAFAKSLEAFDVHVRRSYIGMATGKLRRVDSCKIWSLTSPGSG